MFEKIKMDIGRYYPGEGDFKKFVKFFFNPRSQPVIIYRMSHFFFVKRLKFLAKLFSILNFVIFGTEIAMGAEIEGGFYMPHSLGTIISVKTVGKNFSCYHKVGIGSSMEAGGEDLEKNRPVFGDNVQVFTGATVIGPIKIGNNVTIGANAVVISDVPDNCLAVGVPARIIPKKKRGDTGKEDEGKKGMPSDDSRV
jgi:serine O-acetyltransferase